MHDFNFPQHTEPAGQSLSSSSSAMAGNSGTKIKSPGSSGPRTVSILTALNELTSRDTLDSNLSESNNIKTLSPYRFAQAGQGLRARREENFSLGSNNICNRGNSSGSNSYASTNNLHQAVRRGKLRERWSSGSGTISFSPTAPSTLSTPRQFSSSQKSNLGVESHEKEFNCGANGMSTTTLTMRPKTTPSNPCKPNTKTPHWISKIFHLAKSGKLNELVRI